MNWKTVSFDWNQARAFLATAEEGSLSAAARALGLTQPTLGRQVTALEEELGVVLFERIGRSLELTVSGAELLAHVQTMREGAERVSLAASGQSQTIEGTVRITASDVISAYILPPVLQQIRTIAPLLEIDVVASNDLRDIQRREADIAIRHVRPEQPDLIAKLIAESSGHCYASEDYIDKFGRPTSIDDLSGHQFIGFGDVDMMINYLKPMGFNLTADNFKVGSASGVVSWELGRQGLGIVIMSDSVAKRAPEMVRLFEEGDAVTFPTWLTTHRELNTSRRIRLVFDELAEYLTKTGRI